MLLQFYKHFFSSRYSFIQERYTPPDFDHNLDASHHLIATILVREDLSYNDFLDPRLDLEVLELEALRLEAGFNYKNAIEIRQAISVKKNSPLNELSLIDLKLKSRPFHECSLDLLDTLSSELIGANFFYQSRLLNILKTICNNGGHGILSRSLVDMAEVALENQYQSVPSVNNAIKLSEFYYLLESYDFAQKICHETLSSFGFHDRIVYCLAQALIGSSKFYGALEIVEKHLKNHPDSLWLNVNYGEILSWFGKISEGNTHWIKSMDLLSYHVKNLIDRANSFRVFKNYALAARLYHRVIALIPLYSHICYRIGISAKSSNASLETDFSRQAVLSLPNSYESGIALASTDSENKSFSREVLQSYWREIPYSWCLAERLIPLLDRDDLKLKIEISLQFIDYGHPIHEYPKYKSYCLLFLAYTYISNGYLIETYQILDIFQDILLNSEHTFFPLSLSTQMYFTLGFIVPSVRDDVLFNSLVVSSASLKFKQNLVDLKKTTFKLHNLRPKLPDRHNQEGKPLRIGFMSPNFRFHPVGILSIDIIKELSLLPETEVLVIVLDSVCKDSELLTDAKNTPSLQFVELYDSIPVQIASIVNLELDVLVDLDGLTVQGSTPIIFCRPAVVNCSWLGFDAPYISDQNYFLCDRHTHPDGVDEFYEERLIRLPHSHMCVSGFNVADKDVIAAKKELGISEEQIVFIYTASPRKFNYDLAEAQGKILSRLPNSVLLVKSHSGMQQVLQIFHEELDKLGVDKSRIICLPYAATNEEHRFILTIADIYLDAYPYNGGSITLEALWCELPVVTYCGEQSFARMGYSLLSTLGITDCIAHSWEEYVEWAVRLATDRSLYQKIKQRLYEAKQPETLSPLWNPKQFARDMYDILQDLYNKAGNEQAD